MSENYYDNTTYVGICNDEAIFVAECDEEIPLDILDVATEIIPKCELSFRVTDCDLPGHKTIRLMSDKNAMVCAGGHWMDGGRVLDEEVSLPEPDVANWARFIQQVNPVVRCVISFGRSTMDFRVNARTHKVADRPSTLVGFPLDLAAAFIRFKSENN